MGSDPGVLKMTNFHENPSFYRGGNQAQGALLRGKKMQCSWRVLPRRHILRTNHKAIPKNTSPHNGLTAAAQTSSDRTKFPMKILPALTEWQQDMDFDGVSEVSTVLSLWQLVIHGLATPPLIGTRLRRSIEKTSLPSKIFPRHHAVLSCKSIR